VIPLFHQVLKPGGYLFLGASETVGRQTDLFTPVDRKWKIYSRKEAKRRASMLLPLAAPSLEIAGHGRFLPSPPTEDHGAALVVEKLLMERFVPPCAVVNDKFEVLYLANLTSRFLVRQIGEPTRDLLKMVRDPQGDCRPAPGRVPGGAD
jgi:two-component system CheB/CheR fusion protein